MIPYQYPFSEKKPIEDDGTFKEAWYLFFVALWEMLKISVRVISLSDLVDNQEIDRLDATTQQWAKYWYGTRNLTQGRSGYISVHWLADGTITTKHDQQDDAEIGDTSDLYFQFSYEATPKQIVMKVRLTDPGYNFQAVAFSL